MTYLDEVKDPVLGYNDYEMCLKSVMYLYIYSIYTNSLFKKKSPIFHPSIY